MSSTDEYIAPTTRTFSSSTPIDVSVQNLRGDISLRAEPGDQIRVELAPHGQAGQELVARMEVRFEGGRLTVNAPAEEAQHVGGRLGDLLRGMGGGEGSGGSWTDRFASSMRSTWRSVEGLAGTLDVTVVVPEGSRAVLHDGAGDLRVSGELARVEARTGAGDVRVSNTPADLSVTTGSGDITIEELRGDARLTSGVGDVTVSRALEGALRIRSGTGDVTVRVAEGTATKVDLATGRGDRDVRLSPTSGAGAAERVLEIHARSGVGDVRVLRAEG